MVTKDSLAILIGALVTQQFLNSYVSHNLQEAPVFSLWQQLANSMIGIFLIMSVSTMCSSSLKAGLTFGPLLHPHLYDS